MQGVFAAAPQSTGEKERIMGSGRQRPGPEKAGTRDGMIYAHATYAHATYAHATYAFTTCSRSGRCCNESVAKARVP